MARPPKGMTVLTIVPENYDEIIERSQNSPKEPYTRADLERIYATSREKNVVAYAAFINPSYWEQGIATKE